jgi:VanZ family protein
MAAFFMAATLFVGAETAVEVPLPPPFDKLAHFLYYGLMAGLLAHAVGRRWLWVPLILVPVIGAADEWNQSMIVGRDASFWDWVADEAGTVVAVIAYWRVTSPQDSGLSAQDSEKERVEGRGQSE